MAAARVSKRERRDKSASPEVDACDFEADCSVRINWLDFIRQCNRSHIHPHISFFVHFVCGSLGVAFEYSSPGDEMR